MKHTFIVTVDCGTFDNAVQVMQERLNHDEDYGFPYIVTWEDANLEESAALYEMQMEFEMDERRTDLTS